jgi:hypothetical protein
MLFTVVSTITSDGSARSAVLRRSRRQQQPHIGAMHRELSDDETAALWRFSSARSKMILTPGRRGWSR